MFARQFSERGRQKKIRVAALIRCGELCKSCTRNHCNNLPSKDLPLMLGCPSCDESGCEACDNQGYIEITDCPKDYVGHRVSSAANLAAWVSKGILPEAGGMNDQDAWFVSVQNALESDVNRIEDERRKRG